MQKVRIKKAPQLGDQVDYSFYDSRYRNMGMGGKSENDVTNTMGPVPREEANIEVELGEVVVGDTNQDGFLELFTFTGKPHSKGGTPVNIPPGSFIFSNTKKLFIKDEALLKELFGLAPRKGGYAPAEIAKKYQINDYVNKLRDKESDALTKRTAQTVLDKNLEKLGELALIQESMKGFPDGIPAIALAAAEKMGLTPDALKDMKSQQQGQQQTVSSPQEEMSEPVQSPEEESQEITPEMLQQAQGLMPQGMMRYGGRTLRKYQEAGVANLTPEELQYFRDNYQEPSWGDWVTTPGPFGGDFLSTKTRSFNEPIKRPDYYNPPAKAIPGANNTQGTPGAKFYRDGFEPVEVVSADPSSIAGMMWGDPLITPYIQLSDGTRMSQAEYMYLMNTGSNRYEGMSDYDINNLRKTGNVSKAKFAEKVNSSINSYGNDVITTAPVIRSRKLTDLDDNSKPGLVLTTGDQIEYGDQILKVVNPYGELNHNYKSSGKRFRDIFDNTHGIILTQNPSTGEYVYIEGEDLADLHKITPIKVKKGEYLKDLNNQQISNQTFQDEAAAMGSSYENSPMLSPDKIKQITSANKDTAFYYDKKTGTGGFGPKQPLKVEEKIQGKKKEKTPEKKSDIKVITFEDFKYGGSSRLPIYQTAGTVRPAGTYQQDGKTYYVFYDDSDNTKFATSDAEGKNIVVAKTKRDDKDVRFNQYGSKEIQDIIDESPNTIRTAINRGNFGTQKPITGTGLYSFGKDTEGWKTLPNDWWEDLKKRHGDWIEKDYTGGFEQFKKDLESSKGDDTAGWFQDQVNKYVQNQFGKTYFTPLDEKQTTPYSRDSKFGFVTFSVPRFFDVPPTDVPKDTPPPAEVPKPGKLKAYYCVESQDGTKSVQEVEYDEGSQPTPPTGKTVTPYSNRGAADAGCATVGKITNTSRKFPYTTEWDIKDLTNFMGTITDKPFNRQSVLTQVPDVSMGYQLLDPTYESERIRSVKTGQDQLLANMLPPQVAAAVMASNTGDFLDRHAAEISRVNDQNAQIVNNAMSTNAQLQGANNMQNAQYLDRFRTSTLNNRLANARAKNEDKWREIAAFNRGIKGVQDINALRRMYPHSAADQTFNMTGFAGAPDASIFGPDVMGSTGMAGTTNLNQNALSIAEQARKGATDNGFSPEAAEKIALAAYNKVLSNSSPRGAYQTAYANSMMSGNNSLPAFGALSYNPYED